MDKRKQLRRVDIKSADRGEVSAVFSTFNVRDLDGDVTLPGAFDDGAEVVISSYQHTSWGGALPVGKGRIRTTGTEAILDGRFFLDTTAGRDTFTVVKELGPRQEWSYGYDVLEAESGTFAGEDVQFLKRLKVHEVSPVLVGAGIGTRTLAVKALTDLGYDADTAQARVGTGFGAAIRPHETEASTKAWDPDAARTALMADVPSLRAAHAHVDPSGDPESVASYDFLHHDPDGKANLRACLLGIAHLNGVKSGLPQAQRAAVHEHLAAHMVDADRIPPDLRDDAGGPLKFNEEAAAVLAGLDGLLKRATEVVALRRSKGKALAAGSAEVLEWIWDDTRRLRALLDSPQEDAAREFARYIHSLQQF
jgi:hypothetical protein